MAESSFDGFGSDRRDLQRDVLRSELSALNAATTKTSNIHQLRFDKIANTRLGGVEYRDCVFEGSDDLCKLRIRSHHLFADAPL